MGHHCKSTKMCKESDPIKTPLEESSAKDSHVVPTECLIRWQL